MSPDDLLAHPSQHQPHRAEQPAFDEERDGDRAADPNQSHELGTIRVRPAAKHPIAAKLAQPKHDRQQARGHEPHRQGARHATAHRAQFGQPPDAIHQKVVAHDIHRQRQQADPQRRAGLPQPFHVIAQHIEQRLPRQPPGNRQQIPLGEGTQFGRRADKVKQRIGRDPDNRHRPQRHQQTQPQPLPDQFRHFASPPRSVQLRNGRGDRQDQADGDHIEWQPDVPTNGHGGEIARAEPAGHHGIDGIHRDLGQLRPDERRSEHEQRPRLGPKRAARGHKRNRAVIRLGCGAGHLVLSLDVTRWHKRNNRRFARAPLSGHPDTPVGSEFATRFTRSTHGDRDPSRIDRL